MVSAWARRSAYAWAFLPPVVLTILEGLLFHSAHFGHLIQRRISELMELAFSRFGESDLWLTLGSGAPPGAGGSNQGLPLQPDPMALLSSPALWGGLLVAALFVWVAIVLRRRGDAQ